MRNLAQPLVLWLSLAGCALSMRGDLCVEKPEKLIIYLGSQPLDLDVSYRRFMRALAAEPQSDCENYSVHHVYVSVEDELDAGTALKKAASKNPLLIVAPNAVTAKRALNEFAGKNAPVIFYSQTKLEEEGFGEYISRQDPPTTGVTLHDDLDEKRLSILHEAFPSIRHVGVIADEFWVRTRNNNGELSALAATLGMRLSVWLVESKEDFMPVKNESEREKIDAWYIPPTYAVVVAKDEIIQLTKQQKIPAIYSYREDVERGGFMAYYRDASFIFPALANFALRVCGGELPGSIPVEMPHQTLLSIHSRYDLDGAHVSASVLGQADLIIP